MKARIAVLALVFLLPGCVVSGGPYRAHYYDGPVYRQHVPVYRERVPVYRYDHHRPRPPHYRHGPRGHDHRDGHHHR